MKLGICKGIIALGAVCAMSIAGAKAQGFYWGPRVGLNVSSVTKTTFAKARARANFGLMAGYKINDLAGVQAEVLYSLQGSKVTNSDHVFSYNYLKVPVLAKVYLIGGLNVEAGVSFNWLVRAQEKWTDPESGTKLSKDLGGDTRGFDFTIPVGINYQFARWVDVGLRYDISTVRIPKGSENRAKSSNWSLSVGLRF